MAARGAASEMIDAPPRRSCSGAVALVLCLALAGCSKGTVSGAKVERPAAPLERLAILRVDRVEATADATLGQNREGNPNPLLPADAETVVTAQIYGALANDPRWRLVPDLEVDDAMRGVPLSGSLESRAQALGKEVKADGVVTGHVSRLQDRAGGDYGTRYPASVAFALELVETSTGRVLWSGAFDQTQQDLSSNLFDFWMFWEGGPRWFTSAELTGLGVKKLVETMDSELEDVESTSP